MKRIYMDYASTTPLDPRVGKVMEPFFTKSFGNPSSIHAEGVVAKKALDNARTNVARCLEAHADEIVFTSGGTEANNLAIFGVVNFFTRSDLVKPHIVTTNIEHSSVLEPLKELERKGRAEVTYVPVEENGIVKAENILSAIHPNTVLISVQYANNEIGTIQPIRKIGQLLSSVKGQRSKVKGREKVYPLFHVDACQAPLYLRCLVNALGVDLLTLDAHKIYGPKGVGALYVRRGTPLSPILLGGGQERGLRSTTENIPAIVGFAEALRIATTEREKESLRIGKLRDQLHSDILQNVGMTKVIFNGDIKERLPNNLNISFFGVDTEFLTLRLDAEGIAVSTKSSCLKDEKESYVVSALGGTKERARCSLRFTLGRFTTKKEIERCARVLSTLLRQA
ncbi:MAG: cysteine desulfurase family protein [bacterium]|nr:cysteine desulfurase family protein [bacterium]